MPQQEEKWHRLCLYVCVACHCVKSVESGDGRGFSGAPASCCRWPSNLCHPFKAQKNSPSLLEPEGTLLLFILRSCYRLSACTVLSLASLLEERMDKSAETRTYCDSLFLWLAEPPARRAVAIRCEQALPCFVGKSRECQPN